MVDWEPVRGYGSPALHRQKGDAKDIPTHLQNLFFMGFPEYPQEKVGRRPESRESLVWGTCATVGSMEPF